MRGNSLWGDKTCEGCAEMVAVGACERSQWGLRWSSLGATNRVRGVPKWSGRPHVDPATGAFGGAPYGATKRDDRDIIMIVVVMMLTRTERRGAGG